MEEKYNTSEILDAVEKILKNSKNNKDEKLDANKLPSDTVKIITQAENYIKKN
jgi:hypothetical protein|tara:strand:- start:332 stop:490 length:159 start_codon:yes stop_codon:yes gene_type:complete